MNPQQAETNPDQGPVSRTSRELFEPEKLVVKLQFAACFENLIFLHVFDIRKPKRIAKFDGLEPRHCQDIKAVVAPEIGPKSFGTFEKQGPEVRARFAPAATACETSPLTAGPRLLLQCNTSMVKFSYVMIGFWFWVFGNSACSTIETLWLNIVVISSGEGTCGLIR